MHAEEFKLEWLSDPQIVQVNRKDANSCHSFFIDEKELKQSLNGRWSFSATNRMEDIDQAFWKKDAGIPRGSIYVPGHLQLQGYGQIQYLNTSYPWDGIEDLKPGEVPQDNLVGNYLKFFDLDPVLEGYQIELVLYGVQSAAAIWMNGHFVGYTEDSCSPAAFDVTPYLEKDGNRLAVQVFQHCSGSWLEDQDCFRFSGIFRDVELRAIPARHIEDICISTKLTNHFQDARIQVEMKADNPDGSYRVQLFDPDGHEMISFETISTNLALDFSDARLWSAETPELYLLQIDVLDPEEKLIETIEMPVGLREIVIEDGQILFNGKKLFLHGINRHEFSCRHGRAVTEEEMLHDIQFLKKNNINAVRTSHYPPARRWLELCDEYGIYVMDEVNLETHGTWTHTTQKEDEQIPGNVKDWREAVLDRAGSLYERDKNHPSVIIWSLGNESGAGDVIHEESEFFRQKDSSRPVHYEGAWNNEEFADTSDILSRMYLPADQVEKWLKEHPAKPFILCEYEHGMGNSLGGMSHYMDLEAIQEYHGGFIWDMVDQALIHHINGKSVLGYGGDFGDQPNDGNFCGDGILYADRKASPKVCEVKAQYAPFEIEPDHHGVRIQNKNLFLNSDQFDFVYTATRDGKIVQKGKLETHIEPQKSKKYFINWIRDPKETVLCVSARLKKDMPWAKKGYEVAFGQSVIGSMEHPESDHGVLKIVEGKEHLGFYGPGFSCLFSGQGLLSLKYDGVEMLKGIPSPVFSRAWTDNDRGAGTDCKSAVWMAASLYSKVKEFHYNLQKEQGIGVIVYDYQLPFSGAPAFKLTYSIASPGLIGVDLKLDGKSILPDLGSFGMSFPLVPSLTTFSWMGKGPVENYRDRNKGCKLGWYSMNIRDNISRYLRPQEMGNRTEVRSLSVENSGREGIRFSMVSSFLECSVLPYSMEQLQQADHLWKLNEQNVVYANILQEQMGVGGEDSWQTPVMKPYCLSAAQDREFSFIISSARPRLQNNGETEYDE